MNTKQEILDILDLEAAKFMFPMFDNGYYYHGDQKLSIYRDENRWALIIEIISCNNREIGLNGILTICHIMSNCAKVGANENDNFCSFAKDKVLEDETFSFDKEKYESFLNPKIKRFLIRDQEFELISELSKYKEKKIELNEDIEITPKDFMRVLIPEYSHHFWFTKEEMSKKIPNDLPLLLSLKNWHHPDLCNGKKPSETESFQQFVDVIISGDVSRYTKNEKENTHWSNWEEGGLL